MTTLDVSILTTITDAHPLYLTRSQIHEAHPQYPIGTILASLGRLRRKSRVRTLRQGNQYLWTTSPAWGHLLTTIRHRHPLLARAFADTLTDSWYPSGSTTAIGMKEAA